MVPQVVLADGSVAWVDNDKTDIFYPASAVRTVTHTESNNLFFALRGAGSSFGVVTEFLYMVYEALVLINLNNKLHRTCYISDLKLILLFCCAGWRVRLTLLLYIMLPRLLLQVEMRNYLFVSGNQ